MHCVLVVKNKMSSFTILNDIPNLLEIILYGTYQKQGDLDFSAKKGGQRAPLASRQRYALVDYTVK